MAHATSTGRWLRAALTLGPAVLLGAGLLALGVLVVASPGVPQGALAENTVVGVTLMTTGVALAATAWRPYAAGWLTCGVAVPFGLVFNAFHLSTVLMPARPVGYHPFYSAMMLIVVLLGGAAVLRGRR